MNWKKIKERLLYYAQYSPFTIHTILYVAAALIAYKILYRSPQPGVQDPMPFLPFIMLMGKMALWFMVGLAGISILSTVFTWLYCYWLKEKRGARLQLSFVHGGSGRRAQPQMNAELEGVFRPFLGFVKGRLVYDSGTMTDKFSLLSNKRKARSFWRTGIGGTSRLELPDIREYEIRGGFLFFEDMLHLLSLPIPQKVKGRFQQLPGSANLNDPEVYPTKTEETEVRIDQMRRVEGEYLNYKDFESGDDVRRIVWKVYAKNRDLVVRIPERFEPYASHLYLYASFYVSVRTDLINQGYLREMLNYYKVQIWTVFEALNRKDWTVKYIPDQDFNISPDLKHADRVARFLTASNWQQDRDLSQYVNSRHASVVCISSWTDPDDLERLLDQSGTETVIYFVKCSDVFLTNLAWNWLKRLVLLPPKDRLNRLRSRWIFSPLRYKIKKREKRLAAILKNSGVRYEQL